MHAMLDAFWRSVAYCLHPRVIGLSILPVLLVLGLIAGLGYLYLDWALAAVQHLLESFSLMNHIWAWLESIGAGKLKTVLVPLIVIALATPVVVVVSLLMVATLMTPLMVRLVTRRRFPHLARSGGVGYGVSVLWGLASSVMALLAMVLTIPLWLLPLLILVLPPLIWGWLTYRVLAFDALADHATAEERQLLMQQHRWYLLGMGVLTGYLGAVPSLIWGAGFVAVALMPLLVTLSIWLYTLIFAFSSLWFTHYCLAALQRMRQGQAAVEQPQTVDVLETGSV